MYKNNFDDFLQANNNVITPRRSRSPLQTTNRSPYRQMPTQMPSLSPKLNKENLQNNFAPNSVRALQKPNLSPRQIKNTQRPLIVKSPRKMTPNNHARSYSTLPREEASKPCMNHPNKMAQCRTLIDQEYYFCCGSCSFKLSQQGFELEPVSNSGMAPKGKNMGFNKRKTKAQAFEAELNSFLKMASSIENEHMSSINSFKQTEQNYENQQNLITTFYDELTQRIQDYKKAHIMKLRNKKNHFSQVSAIEVDSLENNLDQIRRLKQDIQKNYESILQLVNEDDFRECMKDHNETLHMYKVKLQENFQTVQNQAQCLFTEDGFGSVAQNIDQQISLGLDYSEVEELLQNQQYSDPVSNRMKREESKMDVLPLQSKNNKLISVKNFHQMLPKGSVESESGKIPAYRDIFEGMEDSSQQAKSPKFKHM